MNVLVDIVQELIFFLQIKISNERMTEFGQRLFFIYEGYVAAKAAFQRALTLDPANAAAQANLKLLK